MWHECSPSDRRGRSAFKPYPYWFIETSARINFTQLMFQSLRLTRYSPPIPWHFISQQASRDAAPGHQLGKSQDTYIHLAVATGRQTSSFPCCQLEIISATYKWSKPHLSCWVPHLVLKIAGTSHGAPHSAVLQLIFPFQTSIFLLWKSITSLSVSHSVIMLKTVLFTLNHAKGFLK